MIGTSFSNVYQVNKKHGFDFCIECSILFVSVCWVPQTSGRAICFKFHIFKGSKVLHCETSTKLDIAFPCFPFLTRTPYETLARKVFLSVESTLSTLNKRRKHTFYAYLFASKYKRVPVRKLST